MITPKFIACVENGVLKFADSEKQRMNQYIRGLKGEVEIVLKKRTKSRSSNQNRYYWGVVIETLSNHIGYEREEMHDTLKILFLRKPAPAQGLPDTLRSTSSLTTVEFEEFLERVRRWASVDFSLSIPLPNEVEYYDN